MPRLPDWDRRLTAVTEKHMRAPGVWGESDCWIFTMEAIEAVTGERMLPALRRYKSERGGFRVFTKAGFFTLEETLGSVLQPVSPLRAQRGDVGTIDRFGITSCGVFTADGFAVKTILGDSKTGAVTGADFRFYPVTSVKAAFKVGRE